MKKRLFLISSLLLTITLSAQVGINTSNPLGIFHVDGAKDNTASPTTTQTANDFVVNASGNVGIGNINPSTKLDITSTSSPAFRLADGTQGAGKSLRSDANGNASWVVDNTASPTVFATFGAGVTITSSMMGDTGYNTGTTITLPANSKYIIMCYMLIPTNTTRVPANGYGWMNTTFTDSPSSNTPSSDLSGTWYNMSGALIPNQRFNMLTGSVIITNSSSTSKTYYYRARLVFGDNLQSNFQIDTFGGSNWGENDIFAVPIN